MACPFVEDPVDEEALLLRRELRIRREVIHRPRLDTLSFPDNFLFERYRFTSPSITYIHNLIRQDIQNITNRGRPLSSTQILCVALRFFANGSFLYNIGDAENISKATVCRAVRKVSLALKRRINSFVVFPGHKPVGVIKEEFHRIAGECRNQLKCMIINHIQLMTWCCNLTLGFVILISFRIPWCDRVHRWDAHSHRCSFRKWRRLCEQKIHSQHQCAGRLNVRLHQTAKTQNHTNNICLISRQNV